MELKPINYICPRCGNGNYMRIIEGKNVGKLNVKCINCNRYFNYDELHAMHTSGTVDIVRTSDYAPVVRCKDCKYRIVNDNAGKKGYMSIKAMCELDNGDIFALGRNADDPNWFCADGERRDEDGTDA